jgi:hypothetical protein
VKLQSRHWRGSGNHVRYNPEGSTLGPACIVQGCGNHTSGTGVTGMCKSCAARKTAYEYMIPAGIDYTRALSPEKRRAATERARQCITPEQRRAGLEKTNAANAATGYAAMKAGYAAMTPEQRSLAAIKAKQAIPLPERRRLAKIASSAMSTEERREQGRKFGQSVNAKLSPEERIRRARHASLAKSPEAVERSVQALLVANAAKKAVRLARGTKFDCFNCHSTFEASPCQARRALKGDPVFCTARCKGIVNQRLRGQR